MKAIVNGKIVLKDRVVENKALLYDEKILGLVGAAPQGVETVDAKGGYVLPGLVDMHIHGYLGEDASDGTYEGIKIMADGVAKNGVTTFLPTTMTVSYDELRKSFECIRQAKADSGKDEWQGARVAGVNAEGPFINPSKRGAQAEKHIRPGDAAFLREYLDILKVFTIAPEMPGNMECIREMAKTGVLISMGHTDATYDQAKAAADAGVGHVTHLFNAQTALKHRDPGVVGEALMDDRLSCELIADTFHVHRDLFRLVARQKGEKLCLITDCTRAGGLEDGEYTLGGQPIFVKGIECRLADGTIAGSVLKLNNAVRNMLAHGDVSISQAVNMASLYPATALKMDGEIGSIEEGKRADFAIVDADFVVQATILDGRTIYTA